MDSDRSSNNKRIAKNTILLYCRTFVVLCVSLYSSRVVLNTLGVDDYGIYNVVGGFVAMFSLISGSLSNAISRYITIELGKEDLSRLKEVFSTSVTIQILLAICIVFVAEIVGVWFLNVKMNVPPTRMGAANWVFQCSILTFAINLISVPYNACIIAHEKMNAFAYVSILEASLKLGAVFLLLVTRFDRLILYSILLVFIAALIRLIYGLYCNRYFDECHYSFSFNKALIAEMSSLAGWNMLGSGGAVLNEHGVNLIMNLFFGVRVNAARGLANQVNAAVTQFVNSFTTAVNPQITKSYAKKEIDYMFNLVMASSKYSFFLMLLLAVPIIVETPFILELWLKRVPDNTVIFVRLTLINSLIATLSSSLYTLAIATGDIKKYQIIVGSLSISCFFITYICFALGMPVQTAYYVFIIVNIAILYARLKVLSSMTGLSIRTFLREVVFRSCAVISLVFVAIYPIYRLLPGSSFFCAVLVMAISILLTMFFVIIVGLTKNERKRIFEVVRAKNVKSL